MIIGSAAFQHEGAIPQKYTCEGDDLSPPLAWSDPPAGTASLALIMDDPDAPDPAAPKRTFVHWVLYNLPAEGEALPEGAGAQEAPLGASTGTNDFGKDTYGGPCPPTGRHRYFFKLYALDVTLPPIDNADKPALLKAMEGHILGEAVLMGTYEKQGA